MHLVAQPPHTRIAIVRYRMMTLTTETPDAKRRKTAHYKGKPFKIVIKGSADSLVSSLASARRDGQLCDAEIICGVSVEACGGNSHRAHRIVLASRSDYMAALLTSDRFSDSSERTIRLPGVTHKAAGNALSWMYGEKIELATLDDAVELVEAASRLQCTELFRILTKKLQRKVDVDNCIILGGLADRLNLTSLALAAEEVAAFYFHVLVDRDNFHHLPPNMMGKLVKRDDLNIGSEEETFTSIIAWLKGQDSQVVASSIVDLISSVRYCYMDKDFYLSTVVTEPILQHPGCFSAIALSQVGCKIDEGSFPKRREAPRTLKRRVTFSGSGSDSDSDSCASSSSSSDSSSSSSSSSDSSSDSDSD